MDTLTPAQRSARMARVRARDTQPELIVRRLVHSLGYRYRLYGRLPGRPDLVFASRKKVLFVHGCFWHRHKKCRKATTPAANRSFWLEKFKANVRRDRRNVRELERAGWRVIVVWQCETTHEKQLADRLRRELGDH